MCYNPLLLLRLHQCSVFFLLLNIDGNGSFAGKKLNNASDDDDDVDVRNREDTV